MDIAKITVTAIEKSVQNSQKIEGYAATRSIDIKERAKELMVKNNVKISARQ